MEGTNEIADRFAIQEINARYAWAVDSNDKQTYLEVWTSNGVSEAPYGNVTGHKELGARFDEMQQEISKNKRHIIANLVIDINGNTAKQKCYLVVLERVGPPAIVATAVYEDELVKTESGWKFSKRVALIDPSWKPKTNQ